MSPTATKLGYALLLVFLGSVNPLSAAFLTVTANTCRYDQPCDFAPGQQANAAGVTIGSSLSRNYSFPSSPGYNFGYSVGASARSETNGPGNLRAYASVGGFALIPAPESNVTITFSAASGVQIEDEFTMPYTGSFRYEWEVTGTGLVSYSAPGTPQQASAGAAVSFTCQAVGAFGAGFAVRPCLTGNAPAPPPGSNFVSVTRNLTNQTFAETIVFNAPFLTNSKTTVVLGFGASAGMGFGVGTPTGILNGLATSDFLSTAKLKSFAVLDANGNVVSNPTVNPSSGFDYFNLGVNDPPNTGVPEPSYFWLLGCGLAGIALRRRAR